MKYTTYILWSICSSLLLTGCKPDGHSELFEMTYTVDFTMQPGLNTVETHFYRIPNVPSTFFSQLSALGREPSDITTVTPKYAELSTVFRDTNLDFIRQVFIRVYDPFEQSQNREVFYLDPVPPNTRTVIRPFPGLADVKDIIEQPFFGVEVGISLWEITTTGLDMRVTLELSANVD